MFLIQLKMKKNETRDECEERIILIYQKISRNNLKVCDFSPSSSMKCMHLVFLPNFEKNASN